MSAMDYYTQQTWVSGVTALSASALNNIDAGLTGVQDGGFFKNGTNVSSDTTLDSGYNYLCVGDITVDSTITLNVQGKLRIL